MFWCASCIYSSYEMSNICPLCNKSNTTESISIHGQESFFTYGGGLTLDSFSNDRSQRISDYPKMQRLIDAKCVSGVKLDSSGPTQGEFDEMGEEKRERETVSH